LPWSTWAIIATLRSFSFCISMPHHEKYQFESLSKERELFSDFSSFCHPPRNAFRRFSGGISKNFPASRGAGTDRREIPALWTYFRFRLRMHPKNLSRFAFSGIHIY
ncbi:MAG: hypothetical protein U0N16_02040, partial [Desulfovibrio sp.]